MDEVDKLLLINLFLNPRASIRELARRLNRSPSAIEYRLKKLKESVIKGVKLYVDPSLFGYSQVIVTYKGEEKVENSVLTFKCVEGFTTSQIFYKGKLNLPKGVIKVFRVNRERVYIPSSRDLTIIKELSKNPLIPDAELAKKVGLSTRSLRRKLDFLFRNNFIRVIPILDLGKLDLLVYAVFSERPVSLPNELWGISDQVKFGIARNIEEIMKIAENYAVSIKSSYDVNNWIENVQLV